MISNFTIKGNKIILKNKGEYFGDKLYQISYLDFKNIEFILNDLLNLKSSSTISKESREAETVASQSGYFLI